MEIWALPCVEGGSLPFFVMSKVLYIQKAFSYGFLDILISSHLNAKSNKSYLRMSKNSYCLPLKDVALLNTSRKIMQIAFMDFEDLQKLSFKL